MKRFILCLFLICLTPITGQEQTSDIVKAPTGETLFRWFGHAGRSYFLQQTDPYNPFQSWYWAPIIEGGNDEDIDYEVDGNADKAFFRLKYTDQVPGSGETLETADFDHDGIPNINEIMGYPPTDPLNPDTDGDTLLDGWEVIHGLDPTDDGSINPDNGANGDPDRDGFTNAQEQAAGTDPGNPDSHPPGTPLPGGAPLLVGEQTTVSNHRWGFHGYQNSAKRYLKSVYHITSTDTDDDGDGGDITYTSIFDDLKIEHITYNSAGAGGTYYGLEWTINSDTSRTRDGTDDDGSGEISTASETLSDEYTIPAFVANVESWIPAYDGHFTVNKKTASISLIPEVSDPEPATDYTITKLKYKWQVNASPNQTVTWLEVFTPSDGTTPIVEPKTWSPSPTDTESPVYEIDPTTRNGKKNGVYSLLPVEVEAVFERDQVANRIPNPKRPNYYAITSSGNSEDLKPKYYNRLFVSTEPETGKVEITVKHPAFPHSIAELLSVDITDDAGQVIASVQLDESGETEIEFLPLGSPVNKVFYVDISHQSGASQDSELLIKSGSSAKSVGELWLG